MIAQNSLLNLCGALLHSTSNRRNPGELSMVFYKKREDSEFCLCFHGTRLCLSLLFGPPHAPSTTLMLAGPWSTTPIAVRLLYSEEAHRNPDYPVVKNFRFTKISFLCYIADVAQVARSRHVTASARMRVVD
jgi:hypothetical protein